MAKRMLIDAAHAEETRVAVIDGNRLEELDFESANKSLLKGNIYLAKVARVEASLQAAFVEYGGNRHGFLAFNEIHPDYYQIPVSDREALLEQQAAEEASASNGSNEDSKATSSEPTEASDESDETRDDAEPVETVSGQEEDEISRRPRALPRYRIQEVIKRRQILLVQVTKEERGNKGAALTTYVSLAGRYCVLMPNTTRSGGISRKIRSSEARKKLRSFVEALDMPDGMAVILRTAGQGRTKAQIKRDYGYLLRLWEQIRKSTLASTAPALIHEEGDLIKRSIRDLYHSEIEEVLVEGETGYRTAKSFMRALMPSHAKRVQPYRDPLPIFTRNQVESQLDSMRDPLVKLRSGGYIVINPTEALVAIDVNSGRATREHNIEETAAKTNIEAASEIARQLRLRDLAGLIVVDFIDMTDRRNIRAVEQRLKDAAQSDRARIQMGRISSFGLLELSRQRLRPSLMEISSIECARCAGTGRVYSTETNALHTLRTIEEEGVRGRASHIRVSVPMEVMAYLMNHKRAVLGEIEARYNLGVVVEPEEADVPPDCRIEIVETKSIPAPEIESPPAEKTDGEAPKRRRRRKRAERATVEAAPEAADKHAASSNGGAETDETADGERPRRRRRGRRGGRRQTRAAENTVQTEDNAEKAVAPPDSGEDSGARPKRQRRTRKAEPTTSEKPDILTEETEQALSTPAEFSVEAAGDAPEEKLAVPQEDTSTDVQEDGSPEANGAMASPDEPPHAEEHPEPTTAPEPADPGGDEAEARGGSDMAAMVSASLAEAPDIMQEGNSREPRRGWWQRDDIAQ